MLERVEPLTCLLQAGAHVGEGERRPIGKVPFGCRAVPGEVAQGKLGQGLGPPEPAWRRHALVHERVGVHALGDSPAADQPVQLGVGQQDHQHLSAAVDTALAQLGSQLCAGQLSPARQDLRDGSDRLVDRALVKAVGGAELLAGDPPYAGTGQVEQPADVLGPHEVPRGPQHVRAHDGAVVQEGRQIGLVRILGARGHCPGRLSGVLCLDG